MARYDAQIDPFNAGEPDMPWDDPESYIGEEENEPATDSEGYQSPVKQPDNYDAPSDDAPSQGSKRLQEKRGQSVNRDSRPTPPVANSRKNGCGCILTVIVVVVLLNFLVPALAFMPRCASLDIGDDNIEVTWDLEDEEALDPDQLTADERSLEEQCAATLDSIASGGGDARTRVAEHFAQTFQQCTGYAVGEFSIDTNAYAEWATEGLSYRIESVYVFDEPGTAPGTVYFEATTADIAGFTEEFYERAYTYLSEQDLHGAGVSALSNAQRSGLQEIFNDLLDKYRDRTSDELFAGLEFNRVGDAWAVTDESCSEAVQHMFWLY